MDRTSELKIEFFELIRLLNQSNLKTNQKTEISFFIELAKNKSVLYATTNKMYRIQLIYKGSDGDWKPCGFCGLTLVEEELSKLFHHQNLEKRTPAEITKIIRSFIFKQFNE